MDSDALVVLVAIGIAACAMLVGLIFASWLAGRSRGATHEPATPAAALPPSVADGIAPRQLPVLAQELSAHADSAAAQAARARAALAAAHAALTAAEAARAQAEAAYDAAHAAHLDHLRTALPHQADPRSEERERQVSRAALDAYRRGEMSAEALRQVFGHADPSPEREAREREADRLALTESQARRAFQQAVAAARVAREELHVVEVAEAAVRQEAADAALEAQDAAIAARARVRRHPGRR
jgi:hypothetical protein